MTLITTASTTPRTDNDGVDTSDNDGINTAGTDGDGVATPYTDDDE